MALLLSIAKIISNFAANAPSMNQDLVGSTTPFLRNSTTNAPVDNTAAVSGFNHGILLNRPGDFLDPASDTLAEELDTILEPCYDYLYNLTVFVPDPGSSDSQDFVKYINLLPLLFSGGLTLSIWDLTTDNANQLSASIPLLRYELLANLTDESLFLDYETPESLAKETFELSSADVVLLITDNLMPLYGHTAVFLADWVETHQREARRLKPACSQLFLGTATNIAWLAQENIKSGSVDGETMIAAALTLELVLLGLKSFVGLVDDLQESDG